MFYLLHHTILCDNKMLCYTIIYSLGWEQNSANVISIKEVQQGGVCNWGKEKESSDALGFPVINLLISPAASFSLIESFWKLSRDEWHIWLIYTIKLKWENYGYLVLGIYWKTLVSQSYSGKLTHVTKLFIWFRTSH